MSWIWSCNKSAVVKYILEMYLKPPGHAWDYLRYYLFQCIIEHDRRRTTSFLFILYINMDILLSAIWDWIIVKNSNITGVG